MIALLDQPQFKYLGVAIFMVGIAYTVMKWVGRELRDQLGPGLARKDDAVDINHVDTVPQALVKEALERGLVTSAQLAAMAPMERQFLFASLRDRLAAPSAVAAGSVTSAASVASGAPGPSAAPHAMNGAEFGLASIPTNDKPHMYCPTCGDALALPAFAPYVAHCPRCGTKTAMREDEKGHYILIVTPVQKAETAPGLSTS